MKTMRWLIAIAVVAIAGCTAQHYGTTTLDNKPVESIRPVPDAATPIDAVATPPDIDWALSVRYCDKPVVVWVQLAKTGNLVRFDAEDPPAKEFKSTAQFLAWIDGVKHDVYDLPCIGAAAQKPMPIDPDDTAPPESNPGHGDWGKKPSGGL